MLFNLILIILLSITIFCALLVIFLENAVYAVLSLVFLFLVVSCVLLMLELEFFALLYIIVYVGAVAVLFLFVIMMLDLRVKTLPTIKTLISFIVLSIFGLINIYNTVKSLLNVSLDLNNIFHKFDNILLSQYQTLQTVPDIVALKVLFSQDYGILLIIVGLMFFIVMLGTINLHVQQSVSISKKIKTDFLRSGSTSIALQGKFTDISYYEKVLYSDWSFVKILSVKEFLGNGGVLSHFHARKKRIQAFRLWDNINYGLPLGKFRFNLYYLNKLQPSMFNFFDHDCEEVEFIFNIENIDQLDSNITTYYNMLWQEFYNYFNYDIK